jgi:hypothetical protein
MIITLCGSTKFKNEYERANLKLTMDGHIVISVAAFGHADAKNFSEADKQKLDKIHLSKIDLADAIFVIDVDGYIGSSTKNEIQHAKTTGKRIFYYSKCVDNISVEEDIPHIDPASSIGGTNEGSAFWTINKLVDEVNSLHKKLRELENKCEQPIISNNN